ncbi:ATP-dependent DNA helicase UvrD/PcrA [Chitinispirillum alkaliphilum]|nr:ATP-dependent DNA helicase UvrD/PcrA [Chitinispirillum alkaliphilum]
MSTKSPTNTECIAELLKPLNNEQLEAVSVMHKKPVLVLAGAGCGKTAVLTRRIAFLCASGVQPSRLLALTFSRKAAQEMASRIQTMQIGLQGCSAPLVTTFHSFALKVLSSEIQGKSNFARIGYAATPFVLSDRESLEIISGMVDIRQRKFLGLSLTELDNHLKRMELFPSKVRNGFDSKQWELLLKIRTDFSEQKKRMGLWGFSDLIAGTIELFEREPVLASYYSTLFDSVLVDEFQDTNPIQIKLLEHLLSGEASLFAVGDDDQAIYGFQGADISSIREFRSRFPSACIIKLQTNYRSVTSILDYANKLWVGKPDEYKKILKCGKPSHLKGCKKPIWKTYNNEKSAAFWILHKAEELQKKERIKISSMAILFRLNKTLNYMKEIMTEIAPASDSLPTFITVHASKGLEYPVVFLCDLEEGVFPHYRSKRAPQFCSWGDMCKAMFKGKMDLVPEETLEEELRLFYVGLTRAERFLFLLTCRNRKFSGRRERLVASRFRKLV